MNIIIGTHGRFGEELVNSAQMICGPLENINCFSLLPEMSFEDFMKEADKQIEAMDGPVVAVVDLFGGTPCNVLTVLSKKYGYDVITGVNLPMIIELYLKTNVLENYDKRRIVEEIIETAKESVVCSNEKL